MRNYSNFIGGECVPAKDGATIETRNPADLRETVAQYPLSKRDDARKAIEAAQSTDRHHRTRSNVAGERRYVIPGRTGDGRRLWVIFADEGGRWGRIITAREPSGQKEQARHRRLRGE